MVSDWILKIGAWPVIITFFLTLIGVFLCGIVFAVYTVIRYKINSTPNPTAGTNVFYGHGPSPSGDDNYDPIGFGSITFDNVRAVRSPLPESTYYVFITVEANRIRFRYDGGNPTSVEGHLLEAGDSLGLKNNKSIKNLKVIAVHGQATINATYSKPIM